MHHELDDNASRLLAALAAGLPLTMRPFADLAEAVGSTEAETIASVRDLRARRIAVRIGGALSPAALGYHASLGAVRIAEEQVEAAVDVLRDMPAVTHVFELEDRYRLWYAVVTPSLSRLEVAEGAIASAVGAADRYRVLPDERYKVTAAFDADGVPEPVDGPEVAQAPGLDRDERALVRLLQGDFPLTERPFSAFAITLSECGFDVDERWVLDRARELAAAGVLRSIAATPRTREEPWRLALTTWIAPGDPADAGAVIASFPEVVHCFQRRVPGAGSAVLALVEASGRAALDQTVARIGAVTELDPPRIAFPVREYARAPLRYFAEGE